MMRQENLNSLKNKIAKLKQENLTLDEVLELSGELLEFTSNLVHDINSIHIHLERLEKEQQQLKREKEEATTLLDYIARLSNEKPQKALEMLERIHKQANSKLIN